MKDKVIATDVDSVLLDYNFHFSRWATKNCGLPIKNPNTMVLADRFGLTGVQLYELIKKFSSHEKIGELSPFYDAVKYVRKLHEEHGYVFHVMSALGFAPMAQERRIDNLKRVFGDVFVEFGFVDIGASKEPLLREYKDDPVFYIDDHAKHVDCAYRLGLGAIWYNAGYRDAEPKEPHREVSSWHGIYNIVTGNRE